MRSIPLAVTWEMGHRCRWQLLSAFLFAIAFPATIIMALRNQGGFDPTHESAVTMHIVFTQISMLVFGSAIFVSQGHPSRMYAYPIPTTSIVFAHLLPGMITVTCGLAVTGTILNAVFQLGWPVWGPAIFSAVAFAALNGVLWLTEKSGWLLIGITCVAFVLGIWNKSRYGAPFSQPEHLWGEVTASDLATMLGFIAAAIAASVTGIARNRRGDPLPAFGIMAFIESVLDSDFKSERPFRSAASAQAWSEWRTSGLALPCIVLFAMFMNGLAWLIFNRNLAAVYPGMLAGGGLLTLGGFVAGIAAGHMGSKDLDFKMGAFLATRPLTSTQLARIILKTAAQSVFVSWIFWLFALIAVRALYLACGLVPQEKFPRELGWWYLPVTLLGPWIITGVVATIGMTGRAMLFVQIFCGLLAAWIAMTICARFVLTDDQLLQLTIAVSSAFGIAFVVATVGMYVVALRRSLIEPLTAYLATGLWIAASLLIAVNWLPSSALAISQCIFVIGLAALAVVPLASAPLALAWNRTR